MSPPAEGQKQCPMAGVCAQAEPAPAARLLQPALDIYTAQGPTTGPDIFYSMF